MPSQRLASSPAPRQLFFNTPEQRTALARQQFFDDGQRPSGLVSELVLQSWMRCAQAGHQTGESVGFDPVSRSRVHAVMQRNRQLLMAAADEVSGLETSLAGIGCRVLLTDGEGVVVHASDHPLPAEHRLLQMASRIGVDLAEVRIGTTAPGVVLRTGQMCTVTGAEHFFNCLSTFCCSAAPIRDVHGRIAGVLDVTLQTGRFDFDAAAVVELCATAIENRLLRAQSQAQVVLQFQAHPSLLGTPLEALAGINSNGQVAWLNRVGQRLSGAQTAERANAEDLLGMTLPALLGLCRQASAKPLRLPNGLGVWVRGRLYAADGSDFRHAIAMTPPAVAKPSLAAAATAVAEPARAPEPPATSLQEQNRQLVDQTLRDCAGNIAQAARQLGVSRGTLYRHLRRGRAAD